MSLPTYRELAAKAERSFPIWGPNSGGGQTVLLYSGNLYDTAYGDESQLPGGAEVVRAVYTPTEYATLFANHPPHAAAIAYLREHGLLGSSI